MPKFSLTHLFLILSFFFAPFRCYVLFNIAGFNVSLFRLFFLLTVSCFFMSLSFIREIRFQSKDPIFVLGAIFFLLTILALLYSEHLFDGDSFTRFVLKLFGSFLSLFLAVYFVNFKDKIQSVINTYQYSSLIPALFGYYQLFSFYAKGTEPKMPFAKFLVVNENLYGTSYNIFLRPSGTFLEPNYFAIFLGSVLMICILQFVCGISKIRNISIALFLLPVFFSTNSFSAFIGFSLSACLILFFKRKSIATRYYAYLISSVFACALFFSSQTFGTNIINAMTLKMQTRSGQSDDLFGRKVFMDNILEASIQNFGLGSGLGGLSQYTGNAISTGHNSYLTVLGEQGFIGFFVLVAFFCGILVRIFSVKDIPEYAASASSISYALLLLLVSNLGYDSLFSYDSSWCLVAISFALVMSIRMNLAPRDQVLYP